MAKVEQLMALVDELETQLVASRVTAANLFEALVAELTAPPPTTVAGRVSGYEMLLNRGHSRISINTAAGGDPPTIDHQVAAIARELSRGTPPSRRVRVTGRLDLMGASQGVLKLTKRSWPR